MTRRTAAFAFCLFAATLPFQLSAQNDASAEPALPAAVDRYVNAYLARNSVPGVVVVITKNTEILLARGYGCDANHQPMSERTPVPIASLSKAFTALAALQLVESGRINLDAPIHDYLPDFELADPRGAQITVRQLLNQTSGMSDKTFGEKSLPQPHSLEEAVARLHAAPLKDAPGTKFNYHNPNYHVAARLVEVASGESFHEYLHQHLFAPLGMNSTTTVARLEDVPGLAKGHIRVYTRPLAMPEPYWFLDGGSGVVTTGHDLARWMVTQMKHGQLPNGPRILSPDGIELSHTASNPAVSNYALGWNDGRTDDGTREIFHSGWMFTYTARMILLPESGFGIAVIANQGLSIGPSDADVLADGIVTLTRGGIPTVGAPAGTIADLVLAALTLLAIALGIWRLKRASVWAKRHANDPRWRLLIVALYLLIPVALLIGFPSLLKWVFGGRDGNVVHLLYMAFPLLAWLAIMAVLNVAVVATRSYHLSKHRNARTES